MYATAKSPTVPRSPASCRAAPVERAVVDVGRELLRDVDRVVAQAVRGGAVAEAAVSVAAGARRGLAGRDPRVADPRLRQPRVLEDLRPVGVDVLGDGGQELLHALRLGAVPRAEDQVVRAGQCRPSRSRAAGDAPNASSNTAPRRTAGGESMNSCGFSLLTARQCPAVRQTGIRPGGRGTLSWCSPRSSRPGLSRSYGRLVALARAEPHDRGRGVRRADRRQRQRQVDRRAHDRRAARAQRGHGPRLRPRSAPASRRAEAARAALALVPDSPLLYDDLTVRQHLELVALVARRRPRRHRRAHRRAARRASASARATDFLPRELSRGMRQKTQLACALDPPRRAARARRAGRRARSAVAGAAAASCCARPSATARRCCSRRTRWRSPTGLADRAVLLEEGEVADAGPVGGGPRARRGARVDVAVAAASTARQPRAVRAWWRELHPPPSLGHRLDLALHDRDHRRDLRRAGLRHGELRARAGRHAGLAGARTGRRSRCVAAAADGALGRLPGPGRVLGRRRRASCSARRCRAAALASRRLLRGARRPARRSARPPRRVLIVGLAGEGRGHRRPAGRPGSSPALAELGVLGVAAAWAVERSARWERLAPAGDWPAVAVGGRRSRRVRRRRGRPRDRAVVGPVGLGDAAGRRASAASGRRARRC